jgi:hypothetical protein
MHVDVRKKGDVKTRCYPRANTRPVEEVQVKLNITA